MFFVLSKILAFLISPINWIAFAIIYALITRNSQRKRKAWIVSAVLFFVFTNGFIANKCMVFLEVESIGRSDIDQTYEMGILLGGMIHNQSDTNLVNFNCNGDRLFQTIDLYKSGMIKKILVSSGSGLVQLPSFKESYLIKKYLERIGIPAEDILIETNSRNTYENAIECNKILKSIYGENHNQEFILITSASHMRRAQACFKKQKINVIPYSTTKRAIRGRRIFTSEMLLPHPNAFHNWKTINHEILGMTIYKISGHM